MEAHVDRLSLPLPQGKGLKYSSRKQECWAEDICNGYVCCISSLPQGELGKENEPRWGPAPQGEDTTPYRWPLEPPVVSTGTANPARGPTAFDGVTSSRAGLREKYDAQQAALAASTPGVGADGGGAGAAAGTAGGGGAADAKGPVRGLLDLARACGTERADLLALDSRELAEWLEQLEAAGTVALDVLSVSLIKRQHAAGRSGQVAVQPQLQAQQHQLQAQQQVYYRVSAQAQPVATTWAALHAWISANAQFLTAPVQVWNGAAWVDFQA